MELSDAKKKKNYIVLIAKKKEKGIWSEYLHPDPPGSSLLEVQRKSLHRRSVASHRFA